MTEHSDPGTSGGPVPPGEAVAPPHRVLGFARAVDAAFDRLGEPPVWAMSPEEQREALRVLHRVSSRLAELELRVLAGAERNEVGVDSGATSTAAWLAHETRQTRRHCSHQVRLAAALDERFEPTREALAAGRIDAEQAAVIVDAVDRLTDHHEDLPPGTHGRAEAHLLELALEFDAAMLRRLGKRLFEVVCPEAADAAEGARLEEEERLARRKAALSMRDNGDGTVDGRFRLPVLHAEALKKALEALTSPRRLGEGRLDPETGRKLDYRTLLGQGFMELIESHLAVDTLPSQGGSSFTVVVTLGLDALLSGLGVATLETGGRISAGEARRLACQAGIIPMVLDGDSVPLDLGRERRLFTKAQRIALAQQYGGCAAANCDRPPSWAEAHHLDPWHRGGRTDLRSGIPLCPPHHHMADHPDAWHMQRMPHGGVRFTRRQ